MKKLYAILVMVLFMAGISAVLLAVNDMVQAQEAPRDQRTHWQLHSGIREVATDKIVSSSPASSHDFTKDECVKTAQLLIELFDLVHSPDGKFTIAFGCKPLDLIDIKDTK